MTNMRFALLCVVLLATAGCTLPSGGPSGGAPVISEATTPICEPYHATASLELAIAYNRTVRVIVEERGTGDPVLNRTYTGETHPTVEYDGQSGVFEPATDYGVTIQIEGEIEWNRTVRRIERWHLRAYRNGTVSSTRPVAVLDTPSTDC
jgi:hypothetical protein